jgi:aminoglycoside phosphotransferase (APT) family kinase protein
MLHAFDPRDLGVPVSASSASEQVRAYVSKWKDWWEGHRLHPNSLVTAGFAWLEDNIPQEIARIVTVHGDPRPANMLIDGGRVTALLDWEFVHAGDPAEDLQYAKGFVEPFLSWEEFRDAYRDAGGAPFSEAGERFYDVFRSLRNFVCCDVSWNGFVTGKYPSFKLASQGIIYKRVFGRVLASSLRAAINS